MLSNFYNYNQLINNFEVDKKTMKKIYRNFVIICLMALSFSSYAQKTQQLKGDAMKEVMVIHDNLMLEMSSLAKLIGQLENKTGSDTQVNEYTSSIKELKASNKSMISWMENFGKRFDADEMFRGKALTEEKQKWIKEEKVKVNALKEQINSSMQKAQELLKKQ